MMKIVERVAVQMKNPPLIVEKWGKYGAEFYYLF